MLALPDSRYCQMNVFTDWAALYAAKYNTGVA